MENNNGKINIIKRFFAPIKEKPILLIKPFLVSCLWIIFPLITVEIFKRATVCIQNGEYEGIRQYVFIYIGISILWVSLGFLLKNVDLVSVNEIEKKIQGERFNKYFKLDNTDVEKLGTGKMQAIMSKGISTWKSLFHKLNSSIPAILITWIFALVQIYQALGIWYCIGFFILPFIVIFFIQYFNSYAIPWRKKRANILTDYNRHFVKILMSKMEIVQNGKEKTEIVKGNIILDEAIEAKKKVCLYLLSIGESVRIFGHALNIFILGYGIHLVNVGGDLSIFVGLIVCSTLFTGAMEKFSSFYKEFTNEFADVEKMWDTFDNMSNMKNIKSKKSFECKHGDIDIENISFGYIEDKYVFDKFSLKIKGGKKTALVGESGSGKSTLIKLIAGYLVPDDGVIYVDDQNISDINIYDYFAKIGYLTQDPSVFDGTIYENLVYALKEQPSDAELKKAIKAAKCEFIYDFTDGLQTEIGERGIRLSGGQKQRLAIAKIMLKNPNIILLDEPTSALDSFNEEEISQALNNLFKGKTVIVVAHRLQTVKSADRILLFENGRVVEDGTHQSLIKKNGNYKRMLDLQSGF